MEVLNNILREIEDLSGRVRGHIAAHQAQLATAAAHPDAVTGTHPDALAANGAREAAAVAAQRDDYKAPEAPGGIVPAAPSVANEPIPQPLDACAIDGDHARDDTGL